jgi:hypothetical protein
MITWKRQCEIMDRIRLLSLKDRLTKEQINKVNNWIKLHPEIGLMIQNIKNTEMM